MFCCARIGCPAVTWPITGIATTFMAGTSRSSRSTSSARGLLGSRRTYPFFARADRWLCTVELLVSPRACPISRTDGGYPWASAYRCTNVKISRWRRVRPFPMATPPKEPDGPRRAPANGCVREYSIETPNWQTLVRKKCHQTYRSSLEGGDEPRAGTDAQGACRRSCAYNTVRRGLAMAAIPDRGTGGFDRRASGVETFPGSAFYLADRPSSDSVEGRRAQSVGW